MARKRGSGPDPNEVVGAALSETLPGLQEHAERTRRYDKAYQIWRGTSALSTSQSQRPWTSRMRIKYGMQVVDQAMVNVVQGAPKAVCTPRRASDVEAAKAMDDILSYFGDLDHLAESEPLVVQQALVYGVSPAKNCWLYREKDVARGWNPMAGRWEPGLVRVVQDDRPTMIPWDVYDCWWEPMARNPDAAAYVVLREWASKDDLLERAFNPDSKTGMLQNLDMLFRSGTANMPQPTAQNQVLGQPVGGIPRDRFEIWEIWRDGRLTVLGNRSVKLYDGPKPYWMPGKPVVIGNSRPDFLRIEGISETELVDDIQQALWTHENLVMENMKMTVMRGATVRETVPDMSQLVLRPNYLWPVTDHDDVHFQDPPPLPAEAYEQRSVLVGAMQYVTGITGAVTGAAAPGPQGGGDTATGISVFNSAASKLLEFKARMIALRVYQRSYEQWRELTGQFLSREMEVRIAGGGWKTYGPQDIYGDYDVRVQAGEESLNRQQKRAEAVALLNALAPFAQFGLNMKKLLSRVAEAYGFDQPDELFQPPAAMPAASPNGQQVATGPQPNTNGNGELLPHPAMASLVGNAR